MWRKNDKYQVCHNSQVLQVLQVILAHLRIDFRAFFLYFFFYFQVSLPPPLSSPLTLWGLALFQVISPRAMLQCFKLYCLVISSTICSVESTRIICESTRIIWNPLGSYVNPGPKRFLAAGSTVPYAGALFGLYFSCRWKFLYFSCGWMLSFFIVISLFIFPIFSSREHLVMISISSSLSLYQWSSR